MNGTRHWPIVVMGTLLSMLLGGCAGVPRDDGPTMDKTSVAAGVPQTLRDLAGEWIYQDSAGEGVIVVNREGFGTYDWKDGRFITETVKRGVWKGKWIQKENDREGGFELVFSNGPNIASGRWWYTRIGKDHDPFDPGGTFTMIRALPMNKENVP